LSPLSQGLFRRAILQSGAIIAWYPALPPATGLAAQSLPVARRSAAASLSFLGCATLECARALPASAVLGVQLAMEGIGTFFQLVLDGATVPADPTVAFLQHGSLGAVDVLAGSNAQEGTLFLYGLATANPLVWYYGPWAPSLAGLTYVAETIFGAGDRAGAVAAAAQYAPARPQFNGSTAKATQALIRDYFFACPARNMLAGLQAARPAAALYAYSFSHVPSWFNCSVDATSELCTLGTHMGALQAAEIPFLFGSSGAVPFNAEKVALADALRTARSMGRFRGHGRAAAGLAGVRCAAPHGHGVEHGRRMAVGCTALRRL